MLVGGLANNLNSVGDCLVYQFQSEMGVHMRLPAPPPPYRPDYESLPLEPSQGFIQKRGNPVYGKVA